MEYAMEWGMRSRPSKKNRRPARNWREGSLPVNPCDDFAAHSSGFKTPPLWGRTITWNAQRLVRFLTRPVQIWQRTKLLGYKHLRQPTWYLAVIPGPSKTVVLWKRLPPVLCWDIGLKELYSFWDGKQTSKAREKHVFTAGMCSHLRDSSTCSCPPFGQKGKGPLNMQAASSSQSGKSAWAWYVHVISMCVDFQYSGPVAVWCACLADHCLCFEGVNSWTSTVEWWCCQHVNHPISRHPLLYKYHIICRPIKSRNCYMNDSNDIFSGNYW